MFSAACYKDPRGEYCIDEAFNPDVDIYDSDYAVSRIWYFMYLAKFECLFCLRHVSIIEVECVLKNVTE